MSVFALGLSIKWVHDIQTYNLIDFMIQMLQTVLSYMLSPRNHFEIIPHSSSVRNSNDGFLSANVNAFLEKSRLNMSTIYQLLKNLNTLGHVVK